jgi:cold shock CspA family protein/tetratricopeptide (TPR) repeat protein
MGKTALAVKTLDDLVYDPDCPYEAVLWASLKTERLTAEGVEAVGTAARDVLGIAAHLARPLDEAFHGTAEELGELLAGIEVLIAIDNVETTSADEIVRFYDAMPDSCGFLLTSRVGLGQLERRIAVGPLDPKSGAKMLRVLAARRGLTGLAQLPPQQLQAQVERLRGTPLAIRWYVEAVAAGLPASVAIKDQSELLRFCLETIYGGLTEAARRCVTVLYAARAGLDASQIAVASDLSADTLARALQDLQRRSLVEVQHAGAEGLYEKYKLTAATTRYLGSVDRPADSVLKDAEKRLAELHASEERRQQEAAGSAVSLYYFDVEEEEQKAIAHILRKALLARKQPAEAEAQLQRAKGLAPEYHEVYRVEGILATNATQYARAREAYERAYELAPDEAARARVAHFFSWLLAEQGDLERALQLETEAHEVLDLPATRTRVGQYLMYAKRFDEAEAMLRPVLGMDDLRSVLIAWTQLLSVTKRRVETLRAARQAGDAVRTGARGLREISAYLDTGVTDSTLRSRALDLALETLQAAHDLRDWGSCEEDAALVLRYATRHANELLVHPDRSFWLRTSRHMRESRSCPATVAESLAALEATLADKEGHELLRGLVAGFDCEKGYGFIEPTEGTERVFFHRSDLRDRGVEVLLMKDTPVSFAVRRVEKGLHASGVRPELAPEVEADLLRNRRGRVVRKYDDYLFALDEHTKATVFVGSHAMPARDWKQLAVGDLLRYDVELVPKGPRAVWESARRLDGSSSLPSPGAEQQARS